MKNPTEIINGVLFHSFFTKMRKEKVGFFEHSILVLQLSGQFNMETAVEKITLNAGEMLLIRKNQLGQLVKIPSEDGSYENIVIFLKEDLLRKIALEEQVKTVKKYVGSLNISIPQNDFLRGFFQSVLPYVKSDTVITDSLGMLKVREAIELILFTMPDLKEFLFDFSDPNKINLEKFMVNNYHFNVPVEKFAQLTGRSLASFKRDFQKIFEMPPRQWLQDRRLTEAKHLIENKNKKPSSIYLDLGFESLSHFSYAFKKKFGNAPTMRFE
jgi:AraC-like DNA-binding protein